MYILSQISLILLCILMFKLKRPYKMAILLFTVICLDAVTLSGIPFGNGKYILSNCFILSEIPCWVRHFKSIKKTILYSFLMAVIISTIILLINSPHYNNSISQTIRLFILEGVGKYFALIYSFICISSERDLKPAIKISFYGVLLLTAFGVLNLLTRHASFIEAIGTSMGLDNDLASGSTYSESARFRVQAMFVNPFNYGYVCIMVMLFHVFGYMKGLMQKKKLYISIVCCLFGIFFCGCRTNILCLFVGITVFVIIAFKIKKWLNYGLIGIIVFCLSYATIPFVQEKVDNMTTMFDTSSQYEGSSISMRLLQYTAVFYHIRDHELFGRGKDYFLIDLGFAGGRETMVDRDLWGLEGVGMSLLLERGIIGLLFYIIIYFIIIRFTFINRETDKTTSALCLSAIATYLIFANATGELGSVYPTLFIAGICIKLLYLKKSKYKILPH